MPHGCEKFRYQTKIAAPALTTSSAEKGHDPIGRKRWAIAEEYIPSQSAPSDRALISHETACILNAGDADAHVAITTLQTAIRSAPTA
jgi:hypothetical protein